MALDKTERLLKEVVADALLENPSVEKLIFLDGIREELEANGNKLKSKETTEEPLEQIEMDDFDDDQWGKWGKEEGDDDDKNEQVYDDVQLKLEMRDRVDNYFKFLHKLSTLKIKNVSLRDGSLAMDGNFGEDTYMRKELLYKLLTKVLHKYDLPRHKQHTVQCASKDVTWYSKLPWSNTTSD
ncbi:unnamed protein product [Lupinus luteus]|uniref:Uncharacterized protein n=1 Tax=Lupinus luteus TaxID=3873 RepID=A0AAV1XP54_LUPLU